MARVLVIEDNSDNLALMMYLLRAYGHTVVTATDGDSGLQAVKDEAPDLVVCDINLPGLDGYEVARRLRADPQYTDLPLVAVSALAMVGDRERGLEAGFDGYMEKPIDPALFVEQVEGTLAPELRGSAPLGARAPEQGSPTGVGAPPAGATVLVVDDSPVNRHLFQNTLEPSGYRVLIAGSVAEAFALMSEDVPDVILSDIHMPVENGVQFFRRVKTDPRLAELPFVFISSSVWDEGAHNAALELDVTRVLLGPIEPQELLKEIASCLIEPRPPS
jgi:two-component system cell cycle response regulator